MELEKEQFIKSIESKSSATKSTYLRQYDKILNEFEKPIGELTNKQIIDFCDTFTSPNSAALVLNVAINVLRLVTLRDVTPLISHRDKIKNKVQTHLVETNNKLIELLPSAEQLKAYTQQLFEVEDYRKYIINYLLCNFFVRNEDLDVKIVDKKTEVDNENNFLLLQLRPARVVYIRNRYKTSKIYNTKTFVIEDKQFYKATKTLLGENLINGNLQHQIKSATYAGLTESNYCKVFIDNIREGGNLNQLNEISQRRGTSVGVLLSSYNIQID